MNIDILKVWNSFATLHDAQTKRQKYYDGQHSFLSKSHNTDGSEKSNRCVNWCAYVIDSHTSASTKNPYQYTLKDEASNKEPMERFMQVIEANDLITLDSEHFKTALTMGYSVEVHSFKDKQIKITQYDPRQWAFIFDTESNLRIGIHKGVIPANTFFNDEFITKDTELYTVYDSQFITTYIKNSNGNLSAQNPIEHRYGEIPIVLFAVNKDMNPFLTENIMGQNDVYNVIANSRIDELTYNVDSGLVLTGFNFDATKKEDMTKLQAMKQSGVFVSPDKDSTIQFLSKGSEADKYNQSLSDAREALLSQAKVPDIRNIVGAVGTVSGLALRLRFQPMEYQANFFWKYIRKGIRQRIHLLNRIWNIQNKTILENYKISFNFATPIDVLAERQSLEKLKGVYSDKTILEISPDIDDPENELERLTAQTAPAPISQAQAPVPAKEEEPLQRIARQEDVIEQAAQKAESKLKNDFLDTLRDTLPQAILESPKLKALLNGSN